MTKISYDYDNFSTRPLKWSADDLSSLCMIDYINEILDEYQCQGISPTLRQLYYQLVARGITKSNDFRTYKNLGNLITKGRNNGLISWTAIIDEDRNIGGIYRHEEDDRQVVRGLEYALTLDFWKRQETYIEVWVEKFALLNVVRKACRPLHVPFMATKGYLSSSEAWEAGQRFKRAWEADKELVILHLADHDPEGLDMTRDVEERVGKYADDAPIYVERIGLNKEQIQQYNPPPNFAKENSPRYNEYSLIHGEECWELDALPINVLIDLIQENIGPYISENVWDKTAQEQEIKRSYLSRLYTNWDDIKQYMDEIDEN